jgi:hypothetical protein
LRTPDILIYRDEKTCNDRAAIFPRGYLNVMINFLLDLITNLAILAMLLTVCWFINLSRPDAKVNGYRVFVALIAVALLFDAALTFLVFADAQTRYGQFSSAQAFIPRCVAYLIACGVAGVLERMHRRKAPARGEACAASRSSTTPRYAKSPLRM